MTPGASLAAAFLAMSACMLTSESLQFPVASSTGDPLRPAFSSAMRRLSTDTPAPRCSLRRRTTSHSISLGGLQRPRHTMQAPMRSKSMPLFVA